MQFPQLTCTLYLLLLLPFVLLTPMRTDLLGSPDSTLDPAPAKPALWSPRDPCNRPLSLTSYYASPFGLIGGNAVRVNTSSGEDCCRACWRTKNCVAASLFLVDDCVAGLQQSKQDLHMGRRDCLAEMHGDYCVLQVTAQTMMPGDLRPNGTMLAKGEEGQNQLYPDQCPLGLSERGKMTGAVKSWEGLIVGPCWRPSIPRKEDLLGFHHNSAGDWAESILKGFGRWFKDGQP